MTATTVHIPTLTTERLTLRAPEARDFDAYAAFRGGPRSAMVGGPHSLYRSYQDLSAIIGHWHMRGFGRWLIADKETDAPLGISGIHFPHDWPEPEIAWSLFEGHEGRGIAFEAASAARIYARETLGMPRPVSLVMPDNTRSNALAQRLGATLEGLITHSELGEMNLWRHAGPEGTA